MSNKTYRNSRLSLGALALATMVACGPDALSAVTPASTKAAHAGRPPS